MKHSRSAWLGASVIAVFSALALPAAASTIAADFMILDGMPSATSGGHVEFTLNGDGTISAFLTSLTAIVGFGFDSATSNLPESNFSVAIVNPYGWLDYYGKHGSGFLTIAGATSISWTIGNPGDFTDVFQAIAGNAADYDFYLRDASGGEWAADAVEVSTVPLPAGAPLLLAGLGAFGLAARRRKG